MVTSEKTTHNVLGTSSTSSVVSCASGCTKINNCKGLLFAKDNEECSYSDSNQDALAETKDRTNSSCYQQLAKTSGTAVRVSVYVTCSTKACSVPEKIAHATASYKSLLAGSSVTYTCDPGFSFYRVNEQKAVCRNNGTWETITDTCVQNTWIKLNHIWNHVFVCVFSIGSSLEFIGVPSHSKGDGLILSFKEGASAVAVKIVFFGKHSKTIMKCITAQNNGDETLTSTFVKDQRFNLTITIRDEGYESLVDGQRALVCLHEKPFKQVDRINSEWSRTVHILRVQIRA